ncbi:MAG: hydroxyacylglutathione hydrolase [Candidatus Berkiella sp.]
MSNVIPITAFKDNYIWAIHSLDDAELIVVDPGDAQPVFDYLQKNKLRLSYILITHHHWDHTGGIKALLAQYPQAQVIGPKNDNVSLLTQSVIENDKIILKNFDVTLNVLDIPGHTLGHIAYYNDDLLFCGDTLFSCGCGRIFEGTPEQMYQSLEKIKKLNKNARVYCGHEYTLANITFAQAVEPNNAALLAYKERVLALRSQGLPSLPSTLHTECEVNPFLRCTQEEIAKAVQKNANILTSDPGTIFAYLREWKNHFSA